MFDRYIHKGGFISIPACNKEYSVDINGIIILKENNSMQSIDQVTTVNGKMVKIDWFDGIKEYPVALVMAIVFKPVHIPVNKWSSLDVLFYDGNTDNIHPNNLVWKYKEPIECDKYPGFFYIPMYTKHCININGVVLNIKFGNVLNYYNKGKGYRAIKLINDLDAYSHTSRHRALSTVFLPYPANVDDLHVNHINGIPGDDRLMNLEWCTAKENSQHAVNTRLIDIGIYVLVRNALTSEVIKYNSLTECALAHNVTDGAIKYRLDAKDQPVYDGKYQFQYVSDIVEWRIPDPAELSENKAKYNSQVRLYARNIITDERVVFESIREASKATDINTGSLREYSDSKRIYGNGWQFGFDDNFEDIDNIELTLQLAKSIQGNRVDIKNIFTNEISTFVSCDEADKAMGEYRGFTATWLKAKNPYPNNGYVIKDTLYKTYWRTYLPIEIEFFKIVKDSGKCFKGRGYIVKNDDGSYELYPWIEELLEKYGLTAQVLRSLIFTGKKLLCGSKRVFYFL